jgi:hypothetical protein
MRLILAGAVVFWSVATCSAQDLLGKVGNGVRQPVPNEQVLTIMMRSALLAIGQANYTNNYSVFRALATKNFREKNDDAAVAAAFAAVRTVPLDYWSVAILPFQLTEAPSVSDGGLLRLTGFVPTRPLELTFQLIFAPEDKGWRLDGIGLGARRMDSPVAPVAQAVSPVATGSVITPRIAEKASTKQTGVVTPGAAAQLGQRK